MNLNKMLTNFIAIRSMTCCHDNKTAFITSMAVTLWCSSDCFVPVLNRSVANMFPSGVVRDWLNEFGSILHVIKQAKRGRKYN